MSRHRRRADPPDETAGPVDVDGSARPRRSPWNRILSIPGALVMVALTTAVTFGVTSLAGSVKESLDAGDPLSITVEGDPKFIAGVGESGHSAVIPGDVPIAGSPGPMGCLGFHQWVRNNQGIDETTTFLQVVVQGNIDDSVLITGLRARVLQDEPPLKGVPVTCPTAGTVEFHQTRIDLDAKPPAVSYSGSEPAPFGVTLGKGESEAYTIAAVARVARYQWALEMDLVVHGEKKTIEITDNGTPFDTTAATAASHWEWNYNDAWQRYAPSNNDQQLQSLPTSIPGGNPLPPLP